MLSHSFLQLIDLNGARSVCINPIKDTTQCHELPRVDHHGKNLEALFSQAILALEVSKATENIGINLALSLLRWLIGEELSLEPGVRFAL